MFWSHAFQLWFQVDVETRNVVFFKSNGMLLFKFAQAEGFDADKIVKT